MITNCFQFLDLTFMKEICLFKKINALDKKDERKKTIFSQIFGN